MKKKLLAILCALAITVGIFTIATAAQADEAAFQVGYAKVDINPYWSVYQGTDKPEGVDADELLMPLPMPGYGSSLARLSAPGLIDDNGDGVVDESDGLHATCVAIRKGDQTLLMISIDLITCHASLATPVREAITAAHSDIASDKIMITASHTHGGVDIKASVSETESYTRKSDGTVFTGTQIKAYLDAYCSHVEDQLLVAATAAIEDLSAATMSKGTIDAGEETGKVMNAVRHYVQTYQREDGTVVEYVRGSSFNNDNDQTDGDHYDDYYNADGTEATHVTESDDSMHLLTFSFEDPGKDEIVLVNWRSHPTTNNKQNSDTYYNISSDYINALRYELEQEDYRASFVLGAAGNLGSNTVFDSEKWLDAQAKADNVLGGVCYGRTLAEVALVLLNKEETTLSGEPMTGSLDTSAIQTSQLTKDDNKFPIQQPSALEIAAANAHNAETGTIYYPYKYTDPDTQEVCMIASASHAKSVINRASYYTSESSNPRRGLELNAILIGSEVAFVTLPIEASDRYFYTISDAAAVSDRDSYNAIAAQIAAANAELTLDNANSYNSWDLLSDDGAMYGTPFVMSCANDSAGYVPNYLAYIYNTDISDSYAVGSYESQTANVGIGSGELLIAQLDTMLQDMVTKTAWCAYCQEDADWIPLTTEILDNDTNNTISGHYYLQEEVTYQQKTLSDGSVLCLDLNGHTYKGTGKTTKYAARAFTLESGAILNISDSSEAQTGTVQGKGGPNDETGSNSFDAGMINVKYGATLNLYSGTLTQYTETGYSVKNGGVISVAGTFNMSGGTVTGGVATNLGGNIYIKSGGAFNMSSGTVTNGEAVSGSSVYAAGNVTLSGDADIHQLWFDSAPADQLTIDGAYTGSVELKLPDTVAVGTDIGNCVNTADISAAEIVVTDSNSLVPEISGTDLVLAGVKAVAVASASGTVQSYDTIEEALEDYYTSDDATHIVLNASMEVVSITPTEDVYLDLNGCDIGTLIVEGDYILYCMDSQTDDYTVEDGNYGKLLSVTGNVAGVPRGTVGYDEPVLGRTSGKTVQCAYLMVTDENDNNAVSFHRTYMELWSVTLHSEVPIENTGIYYESYFQGDAFVAAEVVDYGVATTLTNLATDEAWTNELYTSIEADSNQEEGARKLLYSAYQESEPFAAGAADPNKSYVGTCLNNIMSTEHGPMLNKSRASMTVYGRPYIRTADQVLFGYYTEAFSLQTVTEGLDNLYGDTIQDKYPNIITMYKDGGVTSVMNGWDIPNIKAAAKEEA